MGMGVVVVERKREERRVRMCSLWESMVGEGGVREKSGLFCCRHVKSYFSGAEGMLKAMTDIFYTLLYPRRSEQRCSK